MTLLFCSLTEVQVSFVMSTFLVNENEGPVEVCLLLTGELDRSLNVTVSTVPGTALGRLNNTSMKEKDHIL